VCNVGKVQDYLGKVVVEVVKVVDNVGKGLNVRICFKLSSGLGCVSGKHSGSG
jgi:hypothetical protein